MIDIEYNRLVRYILNNGVWRENRTGIDALTVPHYHIFYDMSEGFPLLTGKKMSIRSIATELEGFLKGITDKKWYKERKCNIWNEWSNPITAKAEFDKSEPNGEVPYNEHNRKLSQELCDDLGPIYGYQWRSFNKTYPGQSEDDGDFHNYTDQLKNIVEKISTNPNDRRMVCSAWNPNQANMMALPPCHILWKVNVLGDKLHLCWFQRSVDTALGLPYNIASYALLQLLLCKQSGLKPGQLSGFLDDVHIYRNHKEQILEQQARPIIETVPQLDIAHNEPFSIKDDKLTVNWTHKDIALFDYTSHEAIKYEVAV